MAALAPQQAVKQPLEAAVRRPGHGGGVGGYPGQILSEHLHAVELDGARREQVPVRQDHGPPAADLLCAAPARHGAARLVKVPGQPGKGHPPAQGQGKGGAGPQDGGPVQQEVVSPPLAQGAEPGKHDGCHQHYRHQGVLPHSGSILPQGGGVEAWDGARLLAGALLRLRHQIGRLVVRGGHAEGVPQAAALPGAAPHGEHQGEAGYRRVAGGIAPLRQQQAGRAVRRHHRGGDHRQQLTGAPLAQKGAEGLGEHLSGQDCHDHEARQQHAALGGRIARPVSDLIAVCLDPHGDHRQQGDQRRRQDGPLAPLGLRPAVRRGLRQLRLRADGVDLRDLLRLRLRLRRGVELLRLHQPPPGEQAPPGPQQRLLGLLFHHRVHGAAHHILQRDGVRRGRQVPLQLLHRVLRPVRRRTSRRLLGRRDLFALCSGGSRLLPRLRLWRRLLQSGLRHGGVRFRLPADLLLHICQKALLPPRAVLYQDLLQGEALLRRRDVRSPGQAAIKLSLVLGSHGAPFLSRVSLPLRPSAGAPPHTAGSPQRRRHSGNSAFPAWGCSPKSHSSRRPDGSCRPPRCR